MRESIWSKSVTLPKYGELQGEKCTDVLVIGGGLCGILCAYFLKQAGVDYLLVEGERIASGVTKNTTAKITSQHGLIYQKIIKDYGTEKAQMYLHANEDALKTYRELCKKIPCDWEERPAYTYSLTSRDAIEREVDAVNRLGGNAEFTNTSELPFDTKGAVCFPHQAQFHPLRFIHGITKDLNMFENTMIREISPDKVVTKQGTIRAKHIIVATHFPFLNKHGGYFLKLYQHRSYVSAYQQAQSMKGMYVDADKKGMSFRTYQDLLLIGGGSHRTGKEGGTWQELHTFANRYYPEAKLVSEWATQDCMSIDGIPYIGQYGKKTPNLYVATGFNKWGMTSSMVSAKILCHMVQEKRHAYQEVFSPQRSMLKPQLFINSIESGIHLVKPTPRRCPHLGCALKWNKQEHTWDCPCHGSRFEEDGTCINGPATGDANV